MTCFARAEPKHTKELPPSVVWVAAKPVIWHDVILHYISINKTGYSFKVMLISSVSQLLFNPDELGGVTGYSSLSSERGRCSCRHSSLLLIICSVLSINTLSVICLFKASPLNLPVTFITNCGCLPSCSSIACAIRGLVMSLLIRAVLCSRNNLEEEIAKVRPL